MTERGFDPQSMRERLRGYVRVLGRRIKRAASPETNPPDIIGAMGEDVFAACKPYTMTSAERMFALWTATRYVVEARIPGDLVECGVYRGGSAMVMAHALRSIGSTDRTLWLYDTFEGMPEPGEFDMRAQSTAESTETRSRWASEQRDGHNAWCFAPLDEVHTNMQRTGYPTDRVRLVKGRVEDTIPDSAPERIAVLRLDTDWYASTRHELEHLYPLVSPGGVLILDDYGHWEGARRAVDELMANRPLLLNRIDYSGRLAVVPSVPDGPGAAEPPSAQPASTPIE